MDVFLKIDITTTAAYVLLELKLGLKLVICVLLSSKTWHPKKLDIACQLVVMAIVILQTSSQEEYMANL